MTETLPFDPLTGLTDRPQLGAHLSSSISRARRDQRRFAVCRLDLEGINQVSNRLGSGKGEQLQAYFARRMRNKMRQGDTLAHLEGNEFVILINDLETHRGCLSAVQRIMDSTRQPYVIENEVATVSANIGIAIFPDDNTDPEELLRHASQAIEIAKHDGGSNNYTMFNARGPLAPTPSSP